MEKQLFQKYSKYSLVLFFLVIIGLSIYLLFPFITAIITAAIIAYVFYPEFLRLNKKIKNKTICALIMIAIILLIVIIPIFFVINALFVESSNFYQVFKNIDLTPISGMVSKYLGESINLDLYIKEIAGTVVSFIIRSVSDFFFSIPQKILTLFIIVFVMYYFFKDGDKIIAFLEKLLPIHKDHKNELLTEFNKVVYATIYGVLLSALIQGMVGTIGLIIFKVQSPVIWGTVMVLTAMIPILGTWIIWLPAALFKILNGDLFNGIGLLLYGVLIISLIDNIIRPKLISEKARIHPVLIVLGIFGGIKMFGLIGIMIGPLLLGIASFMYSFYVKKLK